MTLTDAQKITVTTWIHQGLTLAEIQKRLVSELGLTLTYMEVRFLVDDLKLTPKDPEPAKPAVPQEPVPSEPTPAGDLDEPPALPGDPALPPDAAAGGVRVSVDHLARPGAMVSGQVTFSDGQSATWYLDQMGRLGLGAKQPGYKPSPADLQAFQMALERELAKLGF